MPLIIERDEESMIGKSLTTTPNVKQDEEKRKTAIGYSFADQLLQEKRQSVVKFRSKLGNMKRSVKKEKRQKISVFNIPKKAPFPVNVYDRCYIDDAVKEYKLC